MTPIRCFLLEPTGRSRTAAIPGGGEYEDPIYRRADTGEEMAWWEAPAGALCFMGGPDDAAPKVLMVKTPALPDGTGTADWCPDGGSTTHPAPAWIRTGTPPDIDVKTSIFIAPPNGWHGHLRDGYLVDA